MRPIKFRAWDGSDMFYNVLAGAGSQNVCDFKDDDVWWWHEPPQAIMQFTGLLDKNGKEIYEGDIIKIHDEVNNRDGLFKIIWEEKDARFSAYTKGDNIFCWGHTFWTAYNSEVIGNIYENPELLEGK